MLNTTTVKQAAEERSNRRMHIAHQLNSTVKRDDTIVFARQDGKIKIFHVQWNYMRSNRREITFQVAEVGKLALEGGALWTGDILGLVRLIGEVCSQAEYFQLVDIPRVRAN